MAAIAKFISFDGGIAFSDRVMKIQTQDQEAVTIPLDEVTAVRVRRPQEDSDGFIRVETASGRRYRVFFEDDQLQEAIQFKKQFDATISDGEDDFALAPVPQKAVAPRPARRSGHAESARPSRGYGGRKPIYKRWWFWAACIVLVVGMIGAIAGGSGKDAPASNGASANMSQPAASNADQSAPEQAGVAASGAVKVGEYTIEIKDAFKTTDYEGNPAIVVTYNWTNNSDETTSAMVTFLEKAFQDGIQLETAFLYDVDGYDPDPYMADIRPGASLDVQQAFVLRSASPVEVEVNELFGFSEPVTKTFDPNTM